MDEEEIPLMGGNVNRTVVRAGNTIRRTTTDISPTVHKLLLHLEAKGFDGCPRFLGIDDKQRQIMSFLEGETGIPSCLWRDDAPLIAAARLIRGYHNATLDFARNPSMVWGITYPDPARHGVICHNDFAPYNFIYSNRSPYAAIDFDLAGPGPRLRDVAYAAYWLSPLSFNSEDLLSLTEAYIHNGSRRLHQFCDTYGVNVNKELLDIVYEVFSFMGNKKQVEKILGFEAALKLDTEGHLAHWQREAQSFLENRSRLESKLREVQTGTPSMCMQTNPALPYFALFLLTVFRIINISPPTAFYWRVWRISRC